jgi:hypothetical protein
VLGVRITDEPESRRIGNNWHEGQDLLFAQEEQPCPTCSKLGKPDPDCYRCGGRGYFDDGVDAVIRMLNHHYSELHVSIPKDKAEVERATILTALFAYKLQYDDVDNVDVLAREIPFRIPLIDPRTRRAVPGVVIDGVIDKLVRVDGRHPAVMEHKSTSEDVDPSSDYWGHLRLDTQTLLYLYAAQRLQADGLLEPYGIKSDDAPIDEVLYDAWRKPGIKPKKLSKADTEAFIESGEYFGERFEIVPPDESDGVVRVDGEEVEVEVLKKGFAIRETADMYGARLFYDIGGRPDYYFGRKSINHGVDEIERFEWELFSIYQAIENFREHDCWYKNENECTRFGKCDYAQFCFTGMPIDPKNPPAGFKNIFDDKG